MPTDRWGPGRVVESDLPARLDRLPRSSWHAGIILALGTSRLLDGLAVTLTGSLSGILESKSGLSLSATSVTAAATVYLVGAVVGAIGATVHPIAADMASFDGVQAFWRQVEELDRPVDAVAINDQQVAKP